MKKQFISFQMVQDTILYLAACPTDKGQLNIDAEMEIIRSAERQHPVENKYKTVFHTSVTNTRVTHHLNFYRPRILHISGHGNDDDTLVLEDAQGYQQAISIEALGKQLEIFTPHLQCVVLNTCYSMNNIEIFPKSIRYVIGMSTEIPDELAIQVSQLFYSSLFSGNSIPQSFELANTNLSMIGNGSLRLIDNSEHIDLGSVGRVKYLMHEHRIPYRIWKGFKILLMIIGAICILYMITSNFQ